MHSGGDGSLFVAVILELVGSLVGILVFPRRHRFVPIAHVAFLYVDDGLGLLQPPRVASLLAFFGTMFLCALGVPLSWGKMSVGQTFIWLGWQFDLRDLHVTIPDQKIINFMPLLNQVCDPKVKLERRTVERVISMLLWFTGGCGWLKPWLEPFYKILYKPRAIPRL